MKRAKRHFVQIVLAILVGMGGELHLYFPALGVIAMLDLVAYFLAIPIIILNWNRMGRWMHRSLMWAFAWTFAAIIANMFDFVNMKFFFKCITVVSSSWTIMAVAYYLLKAYPTGYIWYLVGAGIGGWISLYYFRNGALEFFAAGNGAFFGHTGASTESLVEKQIYPLITRGIFCGCLLPFFRWFVRMPAFIAVIGAVFSGFFLLLNGGSRSSFGMYICSAGVGILILYGGRFWRNLMKNSVLMMVLAGLALSVIFGAYQYMATSGIMGDGERNKYENEFEYGEGAVQGRAGFGAAFEDAFESYGIGKGWMLRNHSVMANSLACEGFVGFAFWCYFYWLCLWFVSKRLPYSGKYSIFIVLMILTAGWDVFGSPFGTRHKFFVLMSFMALCKDNPFYGIDEIFSPQLLADTRFRLRGV